MLEIQLPIVNFGLKCAEKQLSGKNGERNKVESMQWYLFKCIFNALNKCIFNALMTM